MSRFIRLAELRPLSSEPLRNVCELPHGRKRIRNGPHMTHFAVRLVRIAPGPNYQ
jgi:hypothetical protein